MASEVGTAYVTLIPSAKGFASKMQSELGGEVASIGTQGGEKYSKGFTDQAQKGIGSRAKGMFKPIITGLLGFAAVEKVGDFLKESVTEAAKAQKEFAVLDNSLKNVGDGSKEAYESAEKFITATSEQTGVTKEDLIPAYSKLIQVTGSSEKAQELLKTSMDASAGTHKSLSTVVDSMSKAYQGNVGALGRLGVKTKDAAGQSLEFDAVLKGMNKRFGGDTAAAANTAAGQMQRLSIQWSDMREEVGAKLIPIVLKLGEFLMTKVIPAVKSTADWFGKHKAAADALKIALGAIVALLIAQKINEFAEKIKLVANATKAWSFVTKAATLAARALGLSTATQEAALAGQTAAQEAATVATEEQTVAQGELDAAMDSNPIGLIVVALAALVAGLIIAYKKSTVFRTIVQDMFKAIKAIATPIIKALVVGFHALVTAISAVVNWTAKHWPLLLTIIAGPIGLVVALVIKNFGRIRAFIATVWNTVRNATGKVWAAIRAVLSTVWGTITKLATRQVQAWMHVFSAAWSTIRNLTSRAWTAIKTAISSVWHGIQSVVSNGVSNVISTLSRLPGMIGGLAGKMLSAGASIGKAIFNGIANALSGVGNLLGDISGALKSGLNNAIGLPKDIGFSVMGHHIGFTIPGFATGARFTGPTYGLMGEGTEPETLFPDSKLNAFLDTMTHRATENMRVASPVEGGRFALTITNWEDGTGYIEQLADRRIGTRNRFASQTVRAGKARA